MKIQNWTWYFYHFHLINTNTTFLVITFKLGFMGDVNSESCNFMRAIFILISQ